MNKRVTAIVEEARKLTHEERLDLLDLLHNEIAGDEAAEGTPEEIEAAWVEELERRIERHERGETTSITHEELIVKLRALIRRP
jgi:putative addiction module component (TIGR02574 family)